MLTIKTNVSRTYMATSIFWCSTNRINGLPTTWQTYTTTSKATICIWSLANAFSSYASLFWWLTNQRDNRLPTLVTRAREPVTWLRWGSWLLVRLNKGFMLESSVGFSIIPSVPCCNSNSSAARAYNGNRFGDFKIIERMPNSKRCGSKFQKKKLTRRVWK